MFSGGVFVGLFDFAEEAGNSNLSSRWLLPQVNKPLSDLVNWISCFSNTSVRINGWLRVCSDNPCSSAQSSAPQVFSFTRCKFEVGGGFPGNFI